MIQLIKCAVQLVFCFSLKIEKQLEYEKIKCRKLRFRIRLENRVI